MRREGLSRAAMLVGLALEGGEALSAAEIARRTGLGERTVVSARHQLVERGIFEIVDPGAGRRPPRYCRVRRENDR